MLPCVAILERLLVVWKLKLDAAIHRLLGILTLLQQSEIPQVALAVGSGAVSNQFFGTTHLQNTVKIATPKSLDMRFAALMS